jgi:hypothetical protein
VKYPYYCTNCESNFDSHPHAHGTAPMLCHKCNTAGTVIHVPTWEASCLAAGVELQRKLKKARLMMGVRS